MSYDWESANKFWYVDIENNPYVKELLENLSFKNKSFLDKDKQKKFIDSHSNKIDYWNFNTITNVLCVDGWYSIVDLWPGTSIAYIKIWKVELDLLGVDKLNKAKFILPEDVNEIKKKDVISLALPLTNFVEDNNKNVLSYSFFFFLEKYDLIKILETILESDITSIKKDFSKFFWQYSWSSERDIEGNIWTIMTLIEQLYLYKEILYYKKEWKLDSYLFIKDWALSFWKFKSIFSDKIEKFLKKNEIKYLIGMEKSGVLKKYLAQNKEHLEDNSYILFPQDFISKELNLPNYTNNFYGHKLGASINPNNFIINYASTLDKKDFEIIFTVLKFIKSYSYKDSILATIFVNSAVSLSEEGKERLKEHTLGIYKK